MDRYHEYTDFYDGRHGECRRQDITFTGQHAEIGGGHMTHRAIWKIEDSHNQEFVMYGTHHSSKEMKILETTYIKTITYAT